MHTEILSYFATNPGAGGIGATAAPGDTLTIKNNRGITGPQIIDLWGSHSTAGFQQLAFPSGHDTTRGYRFGQIPDDTYSHIAAGLSIPITAQEQMTITIAGGAAETDMGSMLVRYPDLPGVDARSLTWAQLQGRYEKLTTVFASLTSNPITVATYSTGVAINSASDLLLANRDYAVLGITTTVDVCAVCITGPDTGYARIGAPGSNQNTDEASQYFCFLARSQDDSLIPVFSSGNKTATLLSCIANATSVTTNATIYLALLKK